MAPSPPAPAVFVAPLRLSTDSGPVRAHLRADRSVAGGRLYTRYQGHRPGLDLDREHAPHAGAAARRESRPRPPKNSSAAATQAMMPLRTNAPGRLTAASAPVASGLIAVPTCTPSASHPNAAPRSCAGTMRLPSE